MISEFAPDDKRKNHFPDFCETDLAETDTLVSWYDSMSPLLPF